MFSPSESGHPVPTQVLNISVLNILIFPINFEICNILLKLDILKMVAWQLMTEKETRKEGKEEEEEGET